MTPVKTFQSENPLRREGLVTINMDIWTAGFWSPARLREIERDRPGELLTSGENRNRPCYIVEVRRSTRNEIGEEGELVGKALHNWTVEIESGGEIGAYPVRSGTAATPTTNGWRPRPGPRQAARPWKRGAA